MPGWLDKEEAAVDSGVLNIPFTLSGKFLAQVGGVLVLDILDDGVPAIESETNISFPQLFPKLWVC